MSLEATVLMAVFNGGRFLPEAIKSILGQTFRDFEFIIVDDGSTDGSGDVIDDYARRDSRIRAVHQQNKGHGAALNVGLALALGRIIVCMDADDVAHPERIARQVTFLDDHPRVAAVGTCIRGIDADGRPLGNGEYRTLPDDVRKTLLDGNSPMAHPSVAMRRDAVLAVGGYHPAFRYAEDFDLWQRLSEHYDLANLPDILLDYRWHDKNTTKVHRFSQSLSAYLARFAGDARRRGLRDPTETLDTLSIADLDRFDQPSGDRKLLLFNLSETALANYEDSRDPALLTAAEQGLARLAASPCPRVRSIATRIARRRLRRGELGNAAKAAWQGLQATRTYQKLSTARALPALVGIRRIGPSFVQFSDVLRRTAAPPPTPCVDHGSICDTPERRHELLRLLIAARGTDDQIDTTRLAKVAECLGDQEISQALLTDAEHHGVTPFLLPVMKEFALRWPKRIAPVVLLGFQLSARHHSRVAELREASIDALIAAFASAGLPLILLKGVALAHVIYRSPAERPMLDIDVLIDDRFTHEAIALCQSLGWVFDTYSSDFAGRHHHLPPARKRVGNTTLMLEIHTDALSSNQPQRLRLCDMTEPQMPVIRGARPAGFAFGPVDMLKHLTAHAFEPARNVRLIHLLDIWRAHACYREEIDAQTFRVNLRLATALRMTASVFLGAYDPAPLPALAAFPKAGQGMVPLRDIKNLGIIAGARELAAPPDWWLHGFYGVPPEASLLRCRVLDHPMTVIRWLFKRALSSYGLYRRLPAPNASNDGDTVEHAKNTQIEIDDRRPLRSETVEVEEIGEDLLLFDPERSVASQLNATAAAIWRLSDGTNTTAEICDALAAHFSVPIGSVTGDVIAVLNEMQELGHVRIA
jgi:glycosyltransferase involved in cell wall biosynthesis